MSFPTASQARSQAGDTSVVLSEIQAIETAVLASVQAGAYVNAGIGGETTMTGTSQTEPTWEISGSPTVAGSGPFLVTFPLPLPQLIAPDVHGTYHVEGSASTGFNVTGLAAYATTTTSITLIYPTTPGTFQLADPFMVAATYTEAQMYYRVWQGLVTDETRAAGMQAVLDNFNQLGYGIKRVTNALTGNTFLWYATW